MNPLTQIKNTQKITARETARGVSDEASWHAKYKESAYVFVGGLPYDLTEGDLLAVFSQYGEIMDVNLVRDKTTGKSKGFAFLAYEDQRSTILAVDNLNGAKVAGRVVRVDHVADYKRIAKEDEDERQKRREDNGVCHAFQRGECSRGDSCRFSHDAERNADTGWGGKDDGGRGSGRGAGRGGGRGGGRGPGRGPERGPERGAGSSRMQVRPVEVRGDAEGLGVSGGCTGGGQAGDGGKMRDEGRGVGEGDGDRGGETERSGKEKGWGRRVEDEGEVEVGGVRGGKMRSAREGEKERGRSKMVVGKDREEGNGHARESQPQVKERAERGGRGMVEEREGYRKEGGGERQKREEDGDRGRDGRRERGSRELGGDERRRGREERRGREGFEERRDGREEWREEQREGRRRHRDEQVKRPREEEDRRSHRRRVDDDGRRQSRGDEDT